MKVLRIKGKWANLNARYISSLIGISESSCRYFLYKEKELLGRELTTIDLGLFIKKYIEEFARRDQERRLNEVKKYFKRLSH